MKNNTGNDFAEQKNVEIKFLKSDNILTNIINTVALPIFVKDDQMRFLLVNDSLCNLLNLQPEILIGTTGYEHFPDDQIKVFYEKDQEVLDTGKENINEENLTDGQGVIRIITTIKTRYTDKDGNKFLVGIINDITERKLAEVEVNKNMASLQQTEVLAKLGNFERNWQTGEGYWSKGFFKLLGIDEKSEALTHKDFTKFIYPDDYERVTGHIKKTLTENKPMNIEFRLVQANGEIIQIHGIAENYYDKDNKPVSTLGVFQDITKSKKAEEALGKVNARHSAMIENIGDVITIMGADGITMYQSPNIEKWFGWTQKDMVDTSGWDFVHPEDIEMSQKEFKGVLEKETFSKVELRFRCKDGNYKWIELSAVNCINDPAIKGVLLNYHDISERKQAKEKLIESEDKYRSLIENIEEIIYFTDTTGKIVHISPQVSRYGYTPHDLLSLGSFIEIIFSEDVERVIAEYEQAITTGEVNPSEYRILDRWGKIHWVETRSRTVRDASGNIIGNTGVLRDIDERKQAEEDLQKSEIKYMNQANFLDAVIENSPFAMQLMNTKGVIIRVNQSLRDIMNLTDDMVVGKYNVLHDENIDAQGFMPDVEAVFNDLKSARFSMFWTGSKAGDVDLSIANERWIDVSMFPIIDEVGKLVNVVCQYVDITDRKQAEKKLEEQNSHLEELVEKRTIELTEKNIELERFNKLFINREFRIKELRDELKKLKNSDK